MSEPAQDLPNRRDIARPFTEAEAFRHARRLYTDLITAQTPSAAASIVRATEVRVFQPACELQLAGLSMLSGRDFPKPQAVVVSLACFGIDHLVSGWTAAVSAQPRLASTLVRSAIEASIFALAAHEDFRSFEKVWTTPKGTGGAVLRTLKKVPRSTYVLVDEVWKLAVPLGHASLIPVMSARGTFLDDAKQTTGISFVGQYAGPMSADLLRNLANLYCLAALVSTEAFALTLRPLLNESTHWTHTYEKLKATIEERTPIPKHLEPYMDQIMGMRRRSGTDSL